MGLTAIGRMGVPQGGSMMFKFVPAYAVALLLGVGITHRVTAGEVAQPASNGNPGLVSNVSPSEPHKIFLVGDLILESPEVQIDAADPTKASLSFTIENRGYAADRLIGATIGTSDPATADPAQTSVVPAASFPPWTIAPGQKLDLLPGTINVVRGAMPHPVKAGDTLYGILLFERGGPLPIDFVVNEGPAQVTHPNGAEPAAPNAPALTPPAP